MYNSFQQLLMSINTLNSTNLLLLHKLVSTTPINVKAMPTNNNDYNCHIKAVEHT